MKGVFSPIPIPFCMLDKHRAKFSTLVTPTWQAYIPVKDNVPHHAISHAVLYTFTYGTGTF